MNPTSSFVSPSPQQSVNYLSVLEQNYNDDGEAAVESDAFEHNGSATVGSRYSYQSSSQFETASANVPTTSFISLTSIAPSFAASATHASHATHNQNSMSMEPSAPKPPVVFLQQQPAPNKSMNAPVSAPTTSQAKVALQAEEKFNGEQSNFCHQSSAATASQFPIVPNFFASPLAVGTDENGQMCVTINGSRFPLFPLPGNFPMASPQLVPLPAQVQFPTTMTPAPYLPPASAANPQKAATKVQSQEQVSKANEFTKLMDEAKRLMNDRQYGPAVSVLEHLKVKNPGSYQVRIFLARCRMHFGNYSEALGDIEEYFRLCRHPKPKVFLNRARVYYEMSKKEHSYLQWALNDLSHVISNCKTFLRDDAKAVLSCYYQRADILYDLYDNQFALHDFNAIINSGEDHSAAVFRRGIMLYEDRRYEEAEMDFNTILNKRRNHGGAECHLWAIDFQKAKGTEGEQKAALELFQNLQRTLKEHLETRKYVLSPYVHVLLAEYYYSQYSVNEAQRVLNIFGIKQYRGSQLANLIQAKILARTSIEQGIAFFDFLKPQGNYSLALYTFAMHLYEEGYIDESVEAAKAIASHVGAEEEFASHIYGAQEHEYVIGFVTDFIRQSKSKHIAVKSETDSAANAASANGVSAAGKAVAASTSKK